MDKKKFLLFTLILTIIAFTAIGKVEASGDLEVTFTTAPPVTINAGESYSFTVTVLNNHLTDAAQAVVFEYRLPLKVAVISISSGAGPCEAGTKNDPSDPATCFLGDMNAGASVDISITVKVDEDVLPGTFLDNDVRALQTGTDDDPPDNQNHAFVEVLLGPADLRLIKVGKPDGGVGIGENLTYTIFVDNLGPSDAANVVVTDDIISSGTYTLVSYESSQGSGSVTDNTITFDLGDLAKGGRATIKIIVNASERQDINNIAHVVSSRFEPDWSNNLAMTMHEIVSGAGGLVVGGLVMPGGGSLQWVALLFLAVIIVVIAALIASKKLSMFKMKVTQE